MRRLTLSEAAALVAIAALVTVAAATSADEFKFLPRAEDFATVCRSVESMSFPGWTVTPARVIDLDDQQADSDKSSENEKMAILKEFHCNEYLSKTYSDIQNKLTLELCRFDSPVGAYGAYTCFRQGASTVVRRGDGSSEDDSSISFWQDHYLVQLQSSGQDTDECAVVMKHIADQIERNIAGHAYVPVVLSELPYMDRVSGTEHVFMGTLAVHKFSPLHMINDHILDGCVIGATVDYQISEPFSERLKVMLINYKDPATAIAACRQLLNDVCPNCGVPQPETPTIFKLAGKFAWCQVHGAKLGVVSNGRRATAVAMIGHQLNW